MSGAKNKEFDSLADIGFVARFGHQELAIDGLLILSQSSSRSFINESNYALSDGFWQMPESMRRHPLYHELWAQPGMAELAAARRANGVPYGLPLPIIEGDDN